VLFTLVIVSLCSTKEILALFFQNQTLNSELKNMLVGEVIDMKEIENTIGDIECGTKQQQLDNSIRSKKINKRTDNNDAVKHQENAKCSNSKRRPGRIAFSFFFALAASVWLVAHTNGMFDGISDSLVALIKYLSSSKGVAVTNTNSNNPNNPKQVWVPLTNGEDGKIIGYILKDEDDVTTTQKEVKREWKPLTKANDTKIYGYVIEETRPDEESIVASHWISLDKLHEQDDSDSYDDKHDDEEMVGYVLDQYAQSVHNSSSMQYEDHWN
jgi:hypothetical protein